MSNNKLRTIFIGTPQFAVASLTKLLNDDYFNVLGVITQPDKKTGRRQILSQSPVKELAIKRQIKILQPEKISTITEDIINLAPEIIVVVAYAQIIPESILSIPKYGCVNVHASLLPKYRGASPIQASILNGDMETGVTIMKMDQGLDTGPILGQSKILTDSEETGESLSIKLSYLGSELLAPTIKKYITGDIKPFQQAGDSSYVKILKKSDGLIDWSKSAEEVSRRIRAMQPWPTAFSTLENSQAKTLKIIKIRKDFLKINGLMPGEIFLSGNELGVKCGSDAVILKILQFEGKNKITDKEFINGYKNYIGKILK